MQVQNRITHGIVGFLYGLMIKTSHRVLLNCGRFDILAYAL